MVAAAKKSLFFLSLQKTGLTVVPLSVYKTLLCFEYL